VVSTDALLMLFETAAMLGFRRGLVSGRGIRFAMVLAMWLAWVWRS